MSELESLAAEIRALGDESGRELRLAQSMAARYASLGQRLAGMGHLRGVDGLAKAYDALAIAHRRSEEATAQLEALREGANGFADNLVGGGAGSSGIAGTRPSAAFSASDRAALLDYTGFGYAAMNAVLRGRQPSDAQVMARAEKVSEALAKLPPYRGAHVFRGTRLTDAEARSYAVGTTRRESAFTSATIQVDSTFPGNVMFYIVSKAGKYVASYSEHPDEQEVLFDKGTTFYVAGNEPGDVPGTYVITLIEVEDV